MGTHRVTLDYDDGRRAETVVTGDVTRMRVPGQWWAPATVRTFDAQGRLLTAHRLPIPTAHDQLF